MDGLGALLPAVVWKLFLDGELRSATIIAVDPGWTVPIPAGRFLRLLDDHDLRDVVVRHGLARLREGERVRSELATLPAGQRLARLLLRFTAITTGPHSSHLDLDQAELGSAIGLARSTVAAELGVLRGQGIISTGRRGVVVLDRDRLIEVAGL